MPTRLVQRAATFLRELKRRKVYQVTAVYLVLIVGGLELLDVLIPATSLPEWASPLILSLAIAGLPTVIVLAWTFDITPSGVVKTTDLDDVEGAKKAAPTPELHDGRTPTSPRADAPRQDGSPRAAGDDSTASRSFTELDPLAVAVLPFDNLSGAKDAEPFAFGLHDDLITELSRASALTVISRTSVRPYRRTEKSLRQIAEELGVGTIVEGGIQQAGNRVRLNIQLIDARTDAHRWAERYDRELTTENIFELQSQLAARIMEELQARLTPVEMARVHHRPTDDLEAYRLYSMGREAAVDRSAEGLQRAVLRFRQALDHDPEYAEAWAGLGMALTMLVGYGHSDAGGLVGEAREACHRAVELGPALPEALAALGNFHGLLGDVPEALAALDEAKRLGPGLAIGFQRASWIHLLSGEPHAAMANAERATQLAPLEPEARSNLAMACLALGKLDRARAETERTLDAHPDFTYGQWVGALTLFLAGEVEASAARMWSIGEDRYRPWALLFDSLPAVGTDDVKTDRTLEELRRMSAPFQAGLLCAAHGDVDTAFDVFEDAWPPFWDAHLVFRYALEGLFEPVRRDARYHRLIARLSGSWGIDI